MKLRDGAFEVDVVFPERVVGIDEQRLRSVGTGIELHPHASHDNGFVFSANRGGWRSRMARFRSAKIKMKIHGNSIQQVHHTFFHPDSFVHARKSTRAR